MQKPSQSFVEKCYKDSDGKVVVAQFPNLSLSVWIIATLLVKVIPEGVVTQLLSVIAFGAIFTWAWLELFSGSTYMRRLLGLVIFVLVIHTQV
ncbi:hypothetical protein KBD20_02470, partial [Candidatus Saccharibacteria bacterium]|nr:hypothetical protein [Candidatus Saccharibacteria bacterium]